MQPLDYERLSSEVHGSLRALSTYTFARLRDESIQPDSLYLRKAYNYGLFIMSQSLFDGVITLSERGQLRDMSIILRSIQEAWVNAFFSYAGPTHVWVYYLTLQSEKSNFKKLKNLYEQGLSEEGIYLEKKRQYDSLLRLFTRRYPNLPIIPNVISETANRSLDRTINLRQRCQIIDFYHTGNTTATFTRNYETVYSFLSETVHVSPRGINALFTRNQDGSYSVDISGGGNRRLLIIIMINAFLYHYDLMKNYNSSISSRRNPIPDELKQARRRLMTLVKQIGKS